MIKCVVQCISLDQTGAKPLYLESAKSLTDNINSALRFDEALAPIVSTLCNIAYPQKAKTWSHAKHEFPDQEYPPVSKSHRDQTGGGNWGEQRSLL